MATELQNREPQEDIDDNFGAVDLDESSGAAPASTSSYCARSISMPSSVSHSYAEHNIPPISAVAARRMLPPLLPPAAPSPPPFVLSSSLYLQIVI